MDKELKLPVQSDKKLHILGAVLSHPTLGFLVPIKDRSPESKALVLHLLPDVEKWPDVAQSVHDETHPLHCLDQIDRCDGWNVLETIKKNVAPKFGDVVLVSVIRNYRL